MFSRIKLLIKIAKLEGIKDAQEHRLSTKLVLDKLGELNDLMLKQDREDKNTDLVKAKIDTLKWVIGDKVDI